MTSTKTGLTAADVALMRQLIAWGKSSGVEYRYSNGVYLWPGDRVPGRRGVTWDATSSPAEVGYARDYGRNSLTWEVVESLTEAVDLLVARGFLPARFSSAYRAGWEACRLAEAELRGYAREGAAVTPAHP